MARNLTPAAAAAAAVVALNEMMALLRPCLSAPPSQFQGGDVGIGVDHAWKLIAPVIVVAMMVMGDIYCVYWIRHSSPPSSTWKACRNSSSSSCNCKKYRVMTKRSIIRADRIEVNRSLECNQVRLNVMKISLSNVMNNIVLDRILLKHYSDI